MSIQTDKNYAGLKVKEGVYIPDVGMDYPQDDPYKRLLKSKHVRELSFDENYTYLDKSLSFKIQHMLGYFLCYGPFFLIQKLKYGIRFNGRDKLRKYRKEFKDGAISICNHCYRWDGLAVVEAVRHRWVWIPMYADHFNGKDFWYLKHVGGVPIPAGVAGLKKFNETFDELHERKVWIHIFPEECNWKFYKPIKPFRKGAFTMAYKYNIPIVPLNVSFRPRTGIHKLFGPAEEPLITVNIGDPIFPDTTRPRKDEVDRLLREGHAAICELAGIVENPWPAFWNEV